MFDVSLFVTLSSVSLPLLDAHIG